MDLSDYEDLDWDEEDDEDGNFQHCLGEGHLGNDPKGVVDEVLAEQPVVSKVRVASAEFAVIGPNAARNMLWTVVFATSARRGDWLRPVTGWRARPAHVREWERATGERWRR
jgi:hypothetical protein